MFGLGAPEIFLIIVIATIILGPEHMPKAARMIGRWSAKLRSAATSFNEAITNDKDLNALRNDLGEVKSELVSAKRELSLAGKEVEDASAGAHAAFREAQAELKNFQATTGRDVKAETNDREADAQVSREDGVSEETDGQPKREEKPSITDYMSRPMGRLGSGDAEKVQSAAPVAGAVVLAKPVLLPGPVSRLVSRKRVMLDMPCAGEAHCAPVLLEAPDMRRACPIVRRLEMPKSCAIHGVKLTRVRLDHV